MDSPNPTLKNPPQIQTQQMSMEKILATHGKVCLQLDAANDELNRGRNLLAHFQAELEKAKLRIAELEVELKAAQEKLVGHGNQEQKPGAHFEVKEN